MGFIKKVLVSIASFFWGVLNIIIITSPLTLIRLFSEATNPFNVNRILVIMLIVAALIDIGLKVKTRNVSFFIGFFLGIVPVCLVTHNMPVHV